MLKFYIKENGTLKQYDVLIAPSINTTFDETLDSASVVLKANDNPLPFTPDTFCQIRFNNDIIANMIIVSDEVSIFNRGNIKYQHTLQLTQSTRLLQKHLVRNSVFSQPREKYKRQYKIYGSGASNGETTSSGHKILNVESIKFNYNEKPLLDENKEINVNVNISLNVARRNNTPSQVTSLLDCEYVESYLANELGYITHFYWKSFISTDSVNIAITSNYKDGTKETKTYNYTASNFPLNQDLSFKAFGNKEISSIDVDVKTPYDGNYYTDASGTIYKFNYNYIRRKSTSSDFYTSVFNIKAQCETYIFTMYDILDTLRHQYYLSNQDYQVSEETITNGLFGIPNSTTELGKILRNTIAPNLTFSGATMYECLAEIFKYYDAIFTLDENNILGIEYLNEYNRNKITSTFTTRVCALNEENFTTGYISYFENALVTESITLNARNSQLGVGSDTSWAFILPHNIQSIEKAEIFCKGVQVYGKDEDGVVFDNLKVNDSWVDVTNFIVSQEIYSTLSQWEQQDNVTIPNLVQANTLAYSGNQIIIGGEIQRWAFTEKNLTLFLRMAVTLGFIGSEYANNYVQSVNSDYKFAKLRITYKAMVNGRVRIENEETKYKGESVVNQANGYVDLNKLGLNMLGLSYKLGQPTLSMTQKMVSWDNRIVKGQIYKYNGDRWLANVVNYTFYNDVIVANINFIKNYNALSQRIQVDHTKRLSQISGELTTKSEDNYCEYLYITSQNISSTLGQKIFLKANKLYNNYLYTFGYNTTKTNLEFAMVNTYYKDKTPIKRYDRTTKTDVNVENLYVPMVKYASGNALCFELSMESPISGGLQTKFTGNNSGYTSNALFSDNGWVDLFTFNFADYDGDFTDEFPYVESFTSMGKVEYMEFYKKPNEIMAMNFELIHLAYNHTNEFIGNALIKQNGLLDNKLDGVLLYYSNEEVYSPLDLKGIGTSTPITDIGTNSDGYKFWLSFNHINVGTTKSWALCDLKGNILYSCNGNINGHTTDTLYFLTRHTRL